MKIDLSAAAAELQAALRPTFPNVVVTAEPWKEDPSRAALFFVEPAFAGLYPLQRYHALAQILTAQYMEGRGLADAVWFELAPGERPEDIDHPDEELLESIAPDVLGMLSQRGFFEALDAALCSGTSCEGDFRHSRLVLEQKQFPTSDHADIFNVLMFRGGFCDCEILYNVAEKSELKQRYWQQQHERHVRPPQSRSDDHRL